MVLLNSVRQTQRSKSATDQGKKPIVPESDIPWSTLWLSKLTSEKTYPSHWKSPNFFSNSPNSKTRLTFIENRGFRKWSLFSFSILEGVEKKMMMRLKNRQAISVRKKGFRNKTFVSSNPGNYWPALRKHTLWQNTIFCHIFIFFVKSYEFE